MCVQVVPAEVQILPVCTNCPLALPVTLNRIASPKLLFWARITDTPLTQPSTDSIELSALKIGFIQNSIVNPFVLEPTSKAALAGIKTELLIPLNLNEEPTYPFP